MTTASETSDYILTIHGNPISERYASMADAVTAARIAGDGDYSVDDRRDHTLCRFSIAGGRIVGLKVIKAREDAR